MKNKNIEELLVYFKSGKFEIAKKKASHYIKEFPNNYFLHNISGVILAKQKNKQKGQINKDKKPCEMYRQPPINKCQAKVMKFSRST